MLRIPSSTWTLLLATIGAANEKASVEVAGRRPTVRVRAREWWLPRMCLERSDESDVHRVDSEPVPSRSSCGDWSLASQPLPVTVTCTAPVAAALLGTGLWTKMLASMDSCSVRVALDTPTVAHTRKLWPVPPETRTVSDVSERQSVCSPTLGPVWTRCVAQKPPRLAPSRPTNNAPEAGARALAWDAALRSAASRLKRSETEERARV